MMVEKINKFIEENKLTDKAAAEHFDISKKYLYAIRSKRAEISKPLWGRLNKMFGCNMPRPDEQRNPDGLWAALPKWVRTAPKEIRNCIEQEYFIDPDRAKYFLENAKTYEDILALRRESYGRAPGVSHTALFSEWMRHN